MVDRLFYLTASGFPVDGELDPGACPKAGNVAGSKLAWEFCFTSAFGPMESFVYDE